MIEIVCSRGSKEQRGSLTGPFMFYGTKGVYAKRSFFVKNRLIFLQRHHEIH